MRRRANPLIFEGGELCSLIFEGGELCSLIFEGGELCSVLGRFMCLDLVLER